MSNTPRIAAAKRDWGHDETGCTVLHIDMDAFYASLEIARHPELRGKPVIIGTGTRSVVSAASYEARQYGINSAMPSARARQLCPQGIFLPVDMTYYRSISHQIFSTIFQHITNRVEQVSVDECYMDVSGALLQWHHPTTIAEWIRQAVHQQYGITCSVGIASNKLIAKMASTNAKPDGMLLIPRNQQARFVNIMPLRAIPGIGPALEHRLNRWGIQSVADMAALDEPTLVQATGSPAIAQHLYWAARGIDNRPVAPHSAEKSIGAERTFLADTTDYRQVADLLRACCDDVAASLRARTLTARTITLKLRFADLRYLTRAHTLEQSTDTAGTLYPTVLALLRSYAQQRNRHAADSRIDDIDGYGNASSSANANSGSTEPMRLPDAIRLAGVSVSALTPANQVSMQPSLDDLLQEQDDHRATSRNTRIRDAEHALDAIRSRYGTQAVSLGLDHSAPSYHRLGSHTPEH